MVLLRWYFVLLAALAFIPGTCDGGIMIRKLTKQYRKLRRLFERYKLNRFQKWMDRHQAKLQILEKIKHRREKNKNRRIDESLEVDIDQSKIMEMFSSRLKADDQRFQHTIMKRDASETEYRHTLMSRPDGPLSVTFVEPTGPRMKRAVWNGTTKWTHDIPYILDDSYAGHEWAPFYVSILKRAMKYISDNLCVTFHDETDSWDAANPEWFTENGYETDAYLIIKSGPGCSASMGLSSGTSGITVYPCWDFQVNTHELLHVLGGAHSQQGFIRDNYMTVNRDDITDSLQVTYDKVDPNVFINEFFDPESLLMYGPKTWSRNGFETYAPIRDDIFDTIRGVSREQTSFYEMSQVFRCNELFCDDDQTDCGTGYHTVVQGFCRCVCPDEMDPDTNCQESINGPLSSNIVEWPKTPMVVIAGGDNDECPTGFEQDTGTFSFTGIWPANMEPVPVSLERDGNDVIFHTCTKSTPTDQSEIDWESWPPGGFYCMMKPQGVDCGGAFFEYTIDAQSLDNIVTTGSLGDTTVNGRNVTMKFCCRGSEKWSLLIDLPNADPFRLWAKGSCPKVRGMREYKGRVSLFTQVASGYGDSSPQYYIFPYELQMYQCYFQPPVYGCNQDITLNAANKAETVTTPGFDSAREPNKRCFYRFNVPEGSKIRITFNEFDLDSNDLLLVKRYHRWQEPHKLDTTSWPYQFISEGDYLSIEYWAGYDSSVINRGVNFTADVILPEESCYDVTKNGADYTGDTTISETYEECIPWVHAMDCSDFPFDALDAVWLLTKENRCRNPDGLLKQPWCYTYKNGTNCHKRYCDVCSLKEPVDVVLTCQDLINEDPDFCNTGLQRFGCFKSCNFQQASHNECPTGWTTYKQRCYKYMLVKKNRYNAEEDCRSHGPSGTLFQIRSLEDQLMIRDMKARSGYDYHHGNWLSGQRGADGDWYFTDTDIKMTYFNWSSSGEPTSPYLNCIKMIAENQRRGDGGGWKGKSCMSASHKSHYICQTDRRATCGPPTIPPDGTLVSELQSFYNEGDVALVRCTIHPNQSINEILCTKDGWTSLQNACDECPKGWTPYGDRCFYYPLDYKNRRDAETECRSYGDSGTLFQVREFTDQQMIREFRLAMGSDYHHGLWLSGELNAENGNWKFTDTDDVMGYFNWSTNAVTTSMSLNCVKMIAEYAGNREWGGWKGKNCDDPNHKASYMCQLDRVLTGCDDKVNSCEEVMTENPDFCLQVNAMDIADQYCLKSCGGCNENTQCSEPISATYSRTSGSGNIEPGQVMTFACNPGLYYVNGDLRRACSSSGNLLGTEPLCQITPVPTDVNLNSVRPRMTTLFNGMAVLLDHDGYRIPFNGKVTKWYYYCERPVSVSFLIYRPNGGGYTYIDSNTIDCVADYRWSYNVPEAQQIQVMEGDVFGVFSPTKYSISITDCHKAIEKVFLVPHTNAADITDLQTKQFTETRCVVPSLGLRVEP